MIDLENLNDQPIEEILEDAKRQIMYLSSDWTNHQESDPGITLLELMVWLKWVQHEYLNRVSVGVKDKFLQLLDVKKYKNRGSEALIEISGLSKDIKLPQGTKWKAGNIIFRNPKIQNLVSSQILSVEFDNPDGKSDEEYYKFDGRRIFELFGSNFRKLDEGKNREFVIKFSNALPSDKDINIYFDMYLGKNLKRNPIGEDDLFEEMADVKWEYYGIKDGKEEWQELKITEDQTHRFLFSGVVTFNISGKMTSYNGVYALRVKLLRQEYDFPPAITNIKMNVFEVIQGNVKCERLIFKKKDIEGSNIKVESHMALYGKHLLYIMEKGGWAKIEGFTFERNINEGEVIFTINGLTQKVIDLDEENEALMLVSYEPKIENRMVLGDGTGTSFQNIEFRERDILYDGFELMVGENQQYSEDEKEQLKKLERSKEDKRVEEENENRESNNIENENIEDENSENAENKLNTEEKERNREIFSIWHRVDDFFSSNKYSKHYILDEKREKIIFGDHFLGMAPRKGKGNIRLCRLETCLGERSNIKKGMITSADTQNEILKMARIMQITDAQGGRDIETMDHAQARSADLFSRCGRAVTMEDYERIVSATPGLIMKNIKILPNYIDGKTVTDQNCVTVAVRWNNKVNVELPESYKRNIIRQIDRYRLINTKTDVIGPVYIGLVISGEVVVNSFYKQGEKLVEKQIERFVDSLNMKFGETLHYGDLFGMLDKLDYVSYLEKLSIIPKGNFIKKTSAEDIIIPPNGIYYVDKIDLNYLRDSYI